MPEKAFLDVPDLGLNFPCEFNPTQYAITKGVNWSVRTQPGFDTPYPEFGGGEAARLQVQLYFDASFDPEAEADDLDANLDDLRSLTEIMDPTDPFSRPPICVFQWGENEVFTGVVQEMTLQYTLFSESGMPLRATADMTFIEVPPDLQPQNPTSHTPEPGYRRRRVLPNETLAWIAFDEYGSAGLWRVIAEANGIDDPLRVAPGQLLAIPPR